MLSVPDSWLEEIAKWQAAKPAVHGLDAGHESWNQGLAALGAALDNLGGGLDQYPQVTCGDGSWINLVEIRIVARIHRIDLMVLGVVVEHREDARVRHNRA